MKRKGALCPVLNLPALKEVDREEDPTGTRGVDRGRLTEGIFCWVTRGPFLG